MRRLRNYGSRALAILALSGALGLTGVTTHTAALAQGNSDAAHACQQGGFAHLVGGDGRAFQNAGECTSYAAGGGTLIPMSTCTVTATNGCLTFDHTALPWLECQGGGCSADPSNPYYQGSLTLTGSFSFASNCDAAEPDTYCLFTRPNTLASGSGFYQARNAAGDILSQGQISITAPPDVPWWQGLFDMELYSDPSTLVTSCSDATYRRIVQVLATLIDSGTGQSVPASVTAGAGTGPFLPFVSITTFSNNRYYVSSAASVGVAC